MSQLPSRRSCLGLLPLGLLHLGLVCSCPAWAQPLDGGTGRLQAQALGKVIGLQGPAPALPSPNTDSAPLVAQLLAGPLTADAAVRIALLNNPAFQVALGRAGLGVTDLQAADNLAKQQAQRDITVLSSRTLKAWVLAVATAQQAQTQRDARDTAQTTDALARRMVQVGNLSKLNQAMLQARVSEATVAQARAEQVAFGAREQLAVLLGLWGAQTQFELPLALPDLPPAPDALETFEAQAVQARVDLDVARQEWDNKRRPATVPGDLWDAMGDAAQVRALAIQVRSQARQVVFAYRSSYDIAQHYQTEVLPLRKFIHDELTLRYNGMLTSIFDVLADSQTQTQAQSAAVAAQRDFWMAHADLQALRAGAPLDALGINTAAGEAPSPTPSSAAH